jgi:hypothetical protein
MTAPADGRVDQEAAIRFGVFRSSRQFVEQRLGVLQIGGVEALGEPAEDRGEQRHGLVRPALLAVQAGEAHSGAQFPGLRVLPSRDVDGLLHGRLGLARRPGVGEQGLAPEPIEVSRASQNAARLYATNCRSCHFYDMFVTKCG